MFNLNFRDNVTGITINDTLDTLYDQYARFGQGCHPLGDNFNPGWYGSYFFPFNCLSICCS